ncbi:MAG: DUF6683 family protein [Blastocatellia bacterium]
MESFAERSRQLVNVCLLGFFVCCSALGQTQGGAAVGGYARIYEAAGKSPAAKRLQEGIGSALQRAVTQSRRPKTSSGTPNKTASSNNRNKITPARRTDRTNTLVLSNRAEPITEFRPTTDSQTFDLLAESLGTTQQEKAFLKELFKATRAAFEKEVNAKGRSNNLTAAYTFFIATAVTVYHDDPEPSDEAIDKLWDGLNNVFGENADLAEVGDAEKQQIYETLVAFSGLLLAGYTEGKNNRDAETSQLYRQLAGVMIQLVLKTDPDKIRFGKDGLNLG